MNLSKKEQLLRRLRELGGQPAVSPEEGLALASDAEASERDEQAVFDFIPVGRPRSGEEREETEVFSVRVPISLMSQIEWLTDKMKLTRNRFTMLALRRQIIDPIDEKELHLLVTGSAINLRISKYLSATPTSHIHDVYTSITGAIIVTDIANEVELPFTKYPSTHFPIRMFTHEILSGTSFPATSIEASAAGAVE